MPEFSSSLFFCFPTKILNAFETWFRVIMITAQYSCRFSFSFFKFKIINVFDVVQYQLGPVKTRKGKTTLDLTPYGRM